MKKRTGRKQQGNSMPDPAKNLPRNASREVYIHHERADHFPIQDRTRAGMPMSTKAFMDTLTTALKRIIPQGFDSEQDTLPVEVFINTDGMYVVAHEETPGQKIHTTLPYIPGRETGGRGA